METSLGEETVGVTAIPHAPSMAEKGALRVLQIGALLIVLAAVTDRGYDLDRFFVPKEATLHVTALLAGVLAVGAVRRVALTWVDYLLAAYLLLGIFSSVLADDGLLAARALAISVSGIAVFWTARALREAGLARPLMRVLAAAVVLGVATSLLQTYGVQSDFFSVNRAPGGTLGNRNFIAHLAAFGLPIVLLVALRAWRGAGYVLGAVGVTLVVGTLVLTRSRAGWLAFGAVIVMFLLGVIFSRHLRRHGRIRRRLAGTVVLLGVGVAAAILVPNSLRWQSENPYLESVAGIANYQEGSGAGRLVQYGRSMQMALDRPLLGVGPGNWAQRYPDYAAPNDPSMSQSQPGATANPWPSSDWVAFIAERGFPAAILLALALIGIAASAVRRLTYSRDEDEGIVAAALLATLAATVMAGLFDAVLLLAHPTLLVWAALGAMWSPQMTTPEVPRFRAPAVLLVLLAIGAGLGAIRSVEQLSRMEIFGLRAEPAGSSYSMLKVPQARGGAEEAGSRVEAWSIPHNSAGTEQ